MVDWMVEVTTSFKCSERTWFLAVGIFDKYLQLNRGIKIFKNSDVHPLGIVSMYLASKYEDIIPINSFIASDKIAHKGVS
jgi:cyclin A